MFINKYFYFNKNLPSISFSKRQRLASSDQESSHLGLDACCLVVLEILTNRTPLEIINTHTVYYITICFIKKICFSPFTLLGTVLLVALGLVTSREGESVVNLEGVQGVRSNSPQDQNYFIFIGNLKKGTSRQRSGKDAIRKRFPLQKPRWEKTKVTIRYFIP